MPCARRGRDGARAPSPEGARRRVGGDPPPPTWYVGIPGSGKTAAAIGEAARAARARGVPLVVVDLIAARNCAALPCAATPLELARRVWRDGESARIVPRDGDELARVLRSVIAGREVELVVDEAALAWSMGAGPVLVELMRQYRHAKVGVRLTTQHLSGDVPQAARALAPTFAVFRCTSPRTLEVLERELGLDPAVVRALPRYEFVPVETGFGSGGVSAEEGGSEQRRRRRRAS